MANWTNEVNPFGANHAPLLTGLASDGSGPVPLAVDKATGSLMTAGGGGGTQYTDGNAAPTHPVGTMPVYNNGGTITAVSAANPLPVSASVTPATGLVSSANSTTSLLLANAAFTGTGASVLGHSVVEVIVYSDQSSAASGLLIEFSTDNTNWDDSSPWTFTPGSTGPNQGQSFIAGVRGQYCRIVYTNGSTNQTTFRLQTVFKPTTVNGDIVSIGQGLNINNHASVTSSQIYGLTTGGGGGYVPVKVNPSGTLTVDASNSTGLVLGAGTAVIGHVITDTGSTTAVTQATAANLNATVVGTGTFATQVTSLPSNASVNLSQLAGNAISSGVGASGTGTIRVVPANDVGKTIKSAAGSVASSGNNTLIVAGTNKLKVFAFSLSTTSTTAVTCIFQDGASGTALWEVILQAPSSVSTGANLSVALPGWLFATSTATLLNLNLSSAQTVYWSASYIDEA